MRTLTVIALVLAAGCTKEASKPAETPKAPEVAKVAVPRTITMDVTADGFVPGNVKLKAGEPVTFVVTRKTDETCATELLIEGTSIKADLPLNKPVEIAWTPTKAGQVKFGCAMDMMVSGMLLVE